MSRFVIRTASEPVGGRSHRVASRPAAGILLAIAALLLVVSTAAFQGDALASGGALDAPETVLAADRKDGKGGGDKAKAGDADERLEASGKAILRDIRTSSLDDVCGGLAGEVVDGIPLCSHGDDPVPEGYDRQRSVEPVRRAAIEPRVACIDDGQSGYRFQVLYVYATDAGQGNRYDAYRDSIRSWVAEVNQIFENSAQLTGGHRQVRLVTDSSCRPVVTPVGLTNAELRTFPGSVEALRKKGYDRFDRNYLMFVDAGYYCGIGSIRNDDKKTQDNYNNTGSAYGRVDNYCWGGSTAAHEVMHNLGGVQQSAPNDTGAWHCVDERDLMCYEDGPSSPKMQDVCMTGVWATLDLFDCGQDDYFSANPAPGTYLSRYWNTADSRFLTNATTPISVSPASGTVGASVIVSLNEFPPGQDITITFDGRPIGTGKVGSNGSARVTVTVPTATTGNQEVFARTGSRSERIDFRVSPAVSSTGKVRKNGTARVSLTGFGAGERVVLKLGNRTLKTVTADASGSAGTTVKVAGSKAKTARLTAVGASSHSADTALTLRGKSGKDKKGKQAQGALVAEAAATDDASAGRDGGKQGAGSGGKQDERQGDRS